MRLKALERQTGSYGTVNAGDIVEVTDSIGEELVANGTFEKTTDDAPTATPQEVSARNESGLAQEPVSTDGTTRELLNTDGRKLHEAPGDMVTEEQVKIEEAVEDELPPAGLVKEEEGAKGRKTKEDKSAKEKDSK